MVEADGGEIVFVDADIDFGGFVGLAGVAVVEGDVWGWLCDFSGEGEVYGGVYKSMSDASSAMFRVDAEIADFDRVWDPVAFIGLAADAAAESEWCSVCVVIDEECGLVFDPFGDEIGGIW